MTMPAIHPLWTVRDPDHPAKGVRYLLVEPQSDHQGIVPDDSECIAWSIDQFGESGITWRGTAKEFIGVFRQA